MEQHGKGGTLDSQAMMDILRNHPGGICMHGGFETTSAMVSELREGKRACSAVVVVEIFIAIVIL